MRIKEIRNIASGRGIEKMEQTTVATVAGLSMAGSRAAVGEAIGAAFKPAGNAIFVSDV